MVLLLFAEISDPIYCRFGQNRAGVGPVDSGRP